MNDEEELRQLTEEYKKLKDKKDMDKEKAVLKKKIWGLKHQRFLNLGLTLDAIYKGIKEMITKSMEKKKKEEKPKEYYNQSKIKIQKIIDIP